MKQIIACLFITLFAAASLKAQETEYGDNVEKRSIADFSAIEASAGIQVIISKGDKEELTVTANNKDYLNEVKTVVQGGVLKIYRSNDWKLWRQWKNWKIKVYVSYTKLAAVKANSGASINGKDVKLETLSAKLNSGGSIRLSGSVQNLDVDGDSGAQFHGYELLSSVCKAEAGSGAGIQVNVSKEISAKANSGGFVRFKGEGLIRDINVNSGGSVKRGS
ncbi:head GIN domain-containing protein [Sediminibacterium soli]|uniref:head GIN domain-containing protein n=1 Tax=Sediminibacterium soli TaxID=2698829 RepID=UPI001379D0E1|nr:head GIN domain-containing protein [Sediminibacterium soli]NCI47060.1 DUF2807 domain-containing protein [Sediminibacterium soli]